jgi:hypothetical protein
VSLIPRSINSWGHSLGRVASREFLLTRDGIRNQASVSNLNSVNRAKSGSSGNHRNVAGPIPWLH